MSLKTLEEFAMFCLQCALFLASLCIICTYALAIGGVLQMHCDKYPGERDECYLTLKEEK